MNEEFSLDSNEGIRRFQAYIYDRANVCYRDLPWRRTKNPYAILISEVMLQQTQATRVIPKFEAWIKTFPTLRSLAKADISQVLALWSGLGYNRRALAVHSAAIELVKRFEGKVPAKEEDLIRLPGIEIGRAHV